MRVSSVISPALLDRFLQSFPELAPLRGVIRYGVRVYKVTYKTTYRGNETVASGAVVLPDVSRPVPVLSYHHGTIFQNKDAPSQFSGLLDMSLEMGLNLILSSCGYVCSVPDYLGFGASRDLFHPYHHAASTAAAAIDMLRAVKELCVELAFPVADLYLLTGYSEGGYATLAIQKEIERHYDGEFPLAAVSAGAGAYDLSGTAREFLFSDVLQDPAYICYLLVAYDSVYGWNRDLAEIFRSPYRERIQEGLLGGNFSKIQIDTRLTQETSGLFTIAFLGDFRGDGEQVLKNALFDNNLYAGWRPSAPTRLYHGTADRTVPARNSEKAENEFRLNGATQVEYIALDGRDHLSGILPWIVGTLLWFQSL